MCMAMISMKRKAVWAVFGWSARFTLHVYAHGWVSDSEGSTGETESNDETGSEGRNKMIKLEDPEDIRHDTSADYPQVLHRFIYGKPVGIPSADLDICFPWIGPRCGYGLWDSQTFMPSAHQHCQQRTRTEDIPRTSVAPLKRPPLVFGAGSQPQNINISTYRKTQEPAGGLSTDTRERAATLIAALPTKLLTSYFHDEVAKQNPPAMSYHVAVCNEISASMWHEHSQAFAFYCKAASLGDTAAMYKLEMMVLWIS
ncbi:hypothetical protein K439DRAFT_1560086 [Ramaria rubella]|nr:hypothetical protein K439DRAFT_1560086 [Ramaria rubella]